MKVSDGRYITMPMWGLTKREVVVSDGVVELVGEHASEHKFSVNSFFSVNKILNEVNHETK